MKAFDFLKRQIEIARVYGIPVRVDYRWFFVFAASVWLIVPAFLPGSRFGAGVGLGAAWVLALVTAAMLFLSIFGHELAHALMARAEGIGTLEIVLHPFGGLARLSHAPETAGAEFRVAIVGPAASFVFALAGFAAHLFARETYFRTTAAVFFIVGLWNLLIAFFNLLPGYPLDGGRVLRAALWQTTGNLAEATRISSLGGQLLAWSLMVIGVYAAVWNQQLAVGVWTIIVGFFLRDAAASVMRETGGSSAGGGRTVADVMRAPVSIEPETLVSTFVDSILPAQRRTAMPVALRGSLHGILTLEDLRSLPREVWHRTRARDVMRPVAEGLFVSPSTQLADAEEIMRHNGAGALGVVDVRGHLVGFLQGASAKKEK